jgi:predicted MPP superfamily phosphohydrolase
MIRISPREVVSVLLLGALVLIVYGLEVLLLARAAVNFARRRHVGKILLTRRAIVLHVLAGTGILCALYGRFIEPYRVQVNVMTLHTPKLKSTGFRIVQISDLHCDTTPHNEEKAVRLINVLRPDIIVATGDYLNHRRALPRLRNMLSRLDAPLGKYAVGGNFEGHQDAGLDILAGTGFHLLRADKATVMKGGDALDIRGLTYARVADWPALLTDVPADRFTVFLFHTPDLIEDIRGRGVDLYLCGHTHGGQVALPWYGALVTFSKFGKKYESGLYQVGETTLYVNRGLGLEPRPAPQVRFFARPEIAVFDILPEQQ